MSIATQIAEQIGGDGSDFSRFDEAKAAAIRTRQHNDECRYEFKDGSAIVESGYGWDIGLSESQLENADLRAWLGWYLENEGTTSFDPAFMWLEDILPDRFKLDAERAHTELTI